MEKKKIAALLYEEKGHVGHLDHLAPFCSLHNIPLFVTSKDVHEIATAQYKDLEVILSDSSNVSTIITKNYDHLVSTLPRQLIDPIFLFDELTLGKRLTTYFLPHGSSDKDNMAKLILEDNIFVYGRRTLELLPEQTHSKTIVTGNFRLKYFNKHQDYYNLMITNRYPEFKNANTNILYAPSWDNDDVSKWTKSLVDHKPNDVHLYIKLHPNTYNEPVGAALPEVYGHYDKVTFIDDQHQMYALLSHMSSIYIDISSVGYDFLEFDRPIFLTVKNEQQLNRCGIHADISDPFKYLGSDRHKEERRSLREKTFDNVPEKISF